MSLSSHLNDKQSPIGQFLHQRFYQTIRVDKEVNRVLRLIPPLLPPTSNWPYSHIGMALNYRLRYYFGVIPFPKLGAWRGACQCVSQNEVEALQRWGHQIAHLPALKEPTEYFVPDTPYQGTYSFETILVFFLKLHTMIEAICPAQRKLSLEQEEVVCRYCFVLALFEEALRSHRGVEGMLLKPTSKNTVDKLLAIPQQGWIDDLCALSYRFYDRYHDFLSRPFVLNPIFAGSLTIDGADPDVIVDHCLIEIKTTKQPAIHAMWLRQLAGYLLLDYTNAFAIQRIGLYSARHGTLFSWPIDAFLQQLTAEPSITVAQLRQEFYTILREQER